MKKLILSIGIIAILCSYPLWGQPYFDHKKDRTGWINETTVYLRVNNQEMGYISYTKLFYLPIYILYNFYVYPAFRHQGYGKALLSYTCHFLKKQGAQKIYIQPGPFEKNSVLSNEQWMINMHKLIALYKTVGFSFVHIVVSKVAFFLYLVFAIPEASHYLMVL